MSKETKKPNIDDVWDKLRKNGGTLHMSLEGGVVADIKNHKPIRLVDAPSKKALADWKKQIKEQNDE